MEIIFTDLFREGIHRKKLWEIMQLNIAVINGEGIGAEIISEELKVINKVEEVYCHEFKFYHVVGAGEAVDRLGNPLQEDTIEIYQRWQGTLV